MLKQISIYCLISLLLFGCCGHFKEKEFIAKYEFEDFSQFNGVSMYFRGSDEDGNYLIFGYAPHLVRDSVKIGAFIAVLDKKNYQIVETKETVVDIAKLQHIVQAFIYCAIPRLDVDEQGNVFVYIKDMETLALARFVNENELLKYPRKWIRIKSCWYKPI